jgi:hypothetical protein
MPAETANVITAIGSAIAAIVTSAALVLGMVFKRQSEKRDLVLAEKAEEVATKTAEVKKALEASDEQRKQHQEVVKDTLNGIAKVTNETNALTNGGMTVQLEAGAISARALAEFTKDKKYIKLAAEADRKLTEHLRQREIADNAKERIEFKDIGDQE